MKFAVYMTEEHMVTAFTVDSKGSGSKRYVYFHDEAEKSFGEDGHDQAKREEITFNGGYRFVAEINVAFGGLEATERRIDEVLELAEQMEAGVASDAAPAYTKYSAEDIVAGLTRLHLNQGWDDQLPELRTGITVMVKAMPPSKYEFFYL